jgi:hypothetical protein
MRVSAYVMLGDPAYMAASVASYYDFVDRIVVSYDQGSRSWSGEPLPVEECFAELTHVDRDRKISHLRGPFSHPDASPLECDTRQRQASLDEASIGADWVLQLDTDEVVPNLDSFRKMLSRAHAADAAGLDFPSRWLYARVRQGVYLEACSRWWRTAAGYPGPLAVRSGTQLKVARQCVGPLFRVDFRSRNSDPWHPRDAPVHATVPLADGVLHFAWVRSDEAMARKARISSHRDDLDWDKRLRRWRARQRRPIWASVFTPLRRKNHTDWLRLARLTTEPSPYAPAS